MPPAPEPTPYDFDRRDTEATSQAPVGNRWRPPPGCSGDQVTFSSSPIDPGDLWYITPQGKLHGSHVTPTDHTYFTHDKLKEYEKHSGLVRSGQTPEPWAPPYDVRSPAGGFIVRIGTLPFGPAPYGYSGVLEDYRVVVWHSCTVSTIYIHLGAIAPEILAVTGPLEGGSSGWHYSKRQPPIPVKAGQVIGKVGGQGIDFSVHDTGVTLAGLAVPAHYDGEPWKIHTVVPFDYSQDTVKAQLLVKNVRKASPFGGKIDYDIPGRLVGSWFLERTVDYSGGGQQERTSFCGNRPCLYWTGHLSIAYGHIDPAQIRISIGADVGIPEDKCRACQSVYGVRGNAPDPAQIGAEAGMVKYELVARGFVEEGGVRERTKNLDDEVVGVFLTQVLDETTIKADVVPGPTSSQASSFSDRARLYHR